MLGRKLYRGYNHNTLLSIVSAINMLSRRKCCPTGCLTPFTPNSHLHIKPCSASPSYHTIQDISSSYVNIHENSRISLVL